MKKHKWKKYTFEFLSIFIAVISAFWLNNWNDNRASRLSEEKILTEIKNGIELDIKDFSGNKEGYNQSLKANTLFKDLIQGKTVNQDSIQYHYIALFRDFVPIINQSGYESLKASGLKIVQNDSLRFEIITLYDFYYGILDKIEYEIDEMKSYVNYYKPINAVLHPYMDFDDQGNFKGFQQPLTIPEAQQKELLSYLWRLETNKRYKLARYSLIEEKMIQLKSHIEIALDER